MVYLHILLVVMVTVLQTSHAKDNPCPPEPPCPREPSPPWPACPALCSYDYDVIDGVICKTDCHLIPAMPGPPAGPPGTWVGPVCSPTGCPHEGIVEPW